MRGLKLKLNLSYLLRTIALQDYNDLARRYGLSKRDIRKIEASLTEGKWKIVA